MEAMIYEWRGYRYGVNPACLRITQNPDAPGYPTVGQIVTIQGHKLLADGDYFVSDVTEFEPPERADEAGRDIRVSLISVDRCSHADMNGANLRRAIVATRAGTVIKHMPL